MHPPVIALFGHSNEPQSRFLCYSKKIPDKEMDLIRKLYIKADGFARGQAMAEYALILAAIAVIVYVAYQTMGTTITTMLTTVDTKL